MLYMFIWPHLFFLGANKEFIFYYKSTLTGTGNRSLVDIFVINTI